MVKYHSDSERGNLLLPHGLFFPINSKVLLYALSHRQDSTYHDLCYTSCGVLARTRNSSMGPPRTINLMTHHTMSERSYHGTIPRYISSESEEQDVDQWLSVSTCSHRSSDQSLMVDPLSLSHSSQCSMMLCMLYMGVECSPLEECASWCSGSLDRSLLTVFLLQSQCSTTGVTMAVVCALLSVG